MREFLLERLKSQLSAEAWIWLEKALRTLSGLGATGQPVQPIQVNTLLGYYAAASRRIGKQALLIGGGARGRGSELMPGTVLSQWGLDEAARAVLLLSLTHLPGKEFEELALQCYQWGDSREQESWLRGLPLLPGSEGFLATAIDACRTNILPIFEAIACENPYPAAHFPEGNFNQLVMKCLFNEIALERIVGLEARLNAELSRMGDDFASEREAAGRSVPRDIWLVVSPFAGREGLKRVLAYLEHEDVLHRHWAALSLGRAGGNPAVELDQCRAALAARLEPESEASVKEALRSSLAKLGEPAEIRTPLSGARR